MHLQPRPPLGSALPWGLRPPPPANIKEQCCPGLHLRTSNPQLVGSILLWELPDQSSNYTSAPFGKCRSLRNPFHLHKFPGLPFLPSVVGRCSLWKGRDLTSGDLWRSAGESRCTAEIEVRRKEWPGELYKGWLWCWGLPRPGCANLDPWEEGRGDTGWNSPGAQCCSPGLLAPGTLQGAWHWKFPRQWKSPERAVGLKGSWPRFPQHLLKEQCMGFKGHPLAFSQQFQAQWGLQRKSQGTSPILRSRFIKITVGEICQDSSSWGWKEMRHI
jgi:hypothetical protein